MIILCNEKDYKKKKINNAHKIVVSTDLSDIEDTDKITQMSCLLPELELMHDYYNDKISEKKYNKKYIEQLESADLYPNLLTLLLVYKQEKKLVIICSRQEREFKYINFLLEYIHNKFGVLVCSYDKWKEKGCPNSFELNKEFLKREVKKYADEIFGDELDERKKKKDDETKKKKNHKKKKKDDDDFDLTDISKKLKKIKIKRV